MKFDKNKLNVFAEGIGSFMLATALFINEPFLIYLCGAIGIFIFIDIINTNIRRLGDK
jgi:hypothetical protein